MNASLLELMRRIALGLPLAVPILTAPLNMGLGCYPIGYECPTEARQVIVEHANDGDLSEVECRAACGEESSSCGSVDPEHVQCVEMVRVCPPAGRPPSGELTLRATPIVPRADLAWLRDATLMEAASVAAFEELAWRLEGLGAPAALPEAARVARDDEARHAGAMAALLARRAGPARVRVSVRRGALGSIPELAADNLVAGCIGEAWGALEAAAQARRAPDPDVRAAMERVAREEARHALLSAAIDRWARARLTPLEERALDRLGDGERARRRDELAGRPRVPGLGLLEPEEAARAFDAQLGRG